MFFGRSSIPSALDETTLDRMVAICPTAVPFVEPMPMVSADAPWATNTAAAAIPNNAIFIVFTVSLSGY